MKAITEDAEQSQIRHPSSDRREKTQSETSSGDSSLKARGEENEGRFQSDSVDSSRFVCGGHSDGSLVPAFRSSDADNLAGDLDDPLFPRAPPFTRSFHAITVLCTYSSHYSSMARSEDCEPLVDLTT
ncbi:hypothetical protein NU219Hw_g5984t1 [Hortaea werneckii]